MVKHKIEIQFIGEDEHYLIFKLLSKLPDGISEEDFLSKAHSWSLEI